MIRYEFWALRGGAPFKKLRVPTTCTPKISYTGSAEIKGTVSLQAEPESDVTWLTDMLAVYRITNNVRQALGQYHITTDPLSTDEYGHQLQELTGYDQTYALRNLSVLEATLTIPAGKLYTDAIREQLLAAGISITSITASDLTLSTTHAFETGTTRYEVISTLLQEINYRDIYFNSDGVAVCEPWKPVTLTGKTHRYGKHETNLLYIPMTVDTDTFDAANVFVDIVSSADLPSELRATAENNDPKSPLSILRRGRRIVNVETVEGIASELALQTHVNRRMLLSMMASDSYTFTSCGDTEQPHGLNDGILMLRDGIGLMEEQDWTLECVPGGQMSHTAKKVYYAFS